MTLTVHDRIKALIVSGLMMAAIFVTAGACSSPIKEDAPITEYPLHGMTINATTDEGGSFFLIAGGYHKDEEQRYFYYAENLDGTVMLHDNKTSDVAFKIIKDGSKPRIECEDDDPTERLTYSGWGMYRFCIFYVPDGSIGSNYDINPIKEKK